jgi:hypothetical protein
MAQLRVIFRGLIRTPVFSLIAILSLALGIGANTAIFSLIDQMMLRTLPVKNPSELVFLYHPGPSQGSVWSDESGGPSFSYPMFRELQKEQTPFTAIATARNTGVSLSYKNAATPGGAEMVSGNYFDLLGVKPALGRLFSEDDDRTPGGHPVVVLSHTYWLSKFNGNPAVLNDSLVVNGYPMTIVGVAQKGFISIKPGANPDIFAPVTMANQMAGLVFSEARDSFRDRRRYWLPIFGPAGGDGHQCFVSRAA